MPRGALPERDESLRAAAVRWSVYAIAALCWIYLLFGSEGLHQQWTRFKAAKVLEGQLALEKEETAKLKADVDALKKDDLAIEQAVRETLDYQRAGERVFIVGDDDPLAAQAAKPAGAAQPAQTAKAGTRFDSEKGGP